MNSTTISLVTTLVKAETATSISNYGDASNTLASAITHCVLDTTLGNQFPTPTILIAGPSETKRSYQLFGNYRSKVKVLNFVLV